MINKGNFAVCDDMFLNRPYIFQDEDRMTQTPAIYSTEEQAKEMAAKLNSQSTTRHYIVRRW